MSNKITRGETILFHKRTFFTIFSVAIAVIVYIVVKELPHISDGVDLFGNKLSKVRMIHKMGKIGAQLSGFSATPWSSIGGCGGGGSGGGAGDGIKWIGNGVSGGLIDVEIINRYNFGQNFNSYSLSPRFTYKLFYTTTIGANLSLSSKTGEVQFRSNQPAETRTTGGFGDCSVDISRTFGSSGEYSLQIGMIFPTGQYDIKRGSDAAREFLPVSLQKGGGLYNASLGFYYTRDVEDGMWLFNASYSFPFAARPLSKKNEFLDSYYTAYKDSTQSRRFYYRFKPYGENDLGGFMPSKLGFGASYAYRGIDHFVHSWSAVFTVPLGVAWIPSEKPNKYDPKPDPDHKAWEAALAYGLEFSNKKVPVFIGISIPIHDKRNTPGTDEYDPKPLGKWDPPDFDDFFQQTTVAIGLKATLF